MRKWTAVLGIAAMVLAEVPIQALGAVRTMSSQGLRTQIATSPTPTPPAKTIIGTAPQNPNPKSRPAISTPANPACLDYTVGGGVAQSAAVITNPAGTPMAWGADNLQPTSTTQVFGDYTPRSVPGPTKAVAVSSQGQDALILINGTVWGWGLNADGGLGVGDTNSRNVATQVPGLNGIVAISSGADHAMALKSDGTLYAWGKNAYGQLGVPPNPPANQSNSPQPVPFAFPAPIVQIAAGNGQSLALDRNGTVWAWGTPLGLPTSVNATPTAVAFSGNPTIVLIALGWDHALAVDSTGTLWTWGGNSQGELGNGTQTSSAVPAILHMSNPIAAVAAGELFSLAVDNAGEVWGWGYNTVAQLGLGNTNSPVLSPLLNNSISGPIALATGDAHAFALFSSGTLYGWGEDSNGQVGTGFVTNDYVNPQVVSLSGVAQPAPCAGPPATGSGPTNGPTPPETNGGRPIDQNAVTCNSGTDPVNCVTGNFWSQVNDLVIPGRGLVISFQRTYNSLLASQPGRLGFGWTDSYNANITFDQAGNPTVHEENGGTLPFTLSGSTYTAPSRVLATLVKNGDGSFTLSRRDKSALTFNSAGLLTKETDRNGYATTLTYSGSQLTTISDPASRQLVLRYNGNGQVSSIVDPANRSVSYAYDVSGNLQGVTDLNGNITSYTYDSTHDLLTIQDPRHGVLTNVYDSQGRVTQQTDPMNLVTKYSYGAGATTITYPNGNQTLETYQNNGIANRIDAYGTGLAASWAYTYDSTTNALATVTDPLGNQTKFTWDASGNLLTVTDPLGNKTTFTYNTFNEILTKTDALNVTTTNVYDSNGNLTSTSTPLVGSGSSSVSTLSYDPNHPGDVSKVTDPDNKNWQFAYDSYGNSVKAIDPLNDTTTYAYDVVGRMTSMVSANGNVTGGNPSQFTSTFTFNGSGDRLTTTDPLGHVTTFTYDANRNLTAVQDPNLHTTTYTFDLDNRQTQVTRPDNSTLKASYDGNGNVLSQTDGQSNVVTFTYDALNNKASMTDGLGRTAQFGFLPTRAPVSVYDSSGRVTSLAYDAAGRVTTVTYSDGNTPNVVYAYDPDNQRTSMQDGTGTTTYSYDSLHRITQTKDGAGASISYGYDLKGHLTSLTYPGGTNKVTRTYDAAGRLSSIADWNGLTTSFAYDANSNLTTWTYPNTTAGTWTYDRADHLTNITYTTGSKHTVFLNLNYSRDSNSQLTAENGQTYGYDSLNRVSSAPPSTYNYDNADELTQLAVTGGNTTTFAYDQANQLSTQTVTNGSTQVQKYTYTYDPNGNRTKRVDQANNTLTLSFDQANRMTAYSSTSTYAYNGDGVRTKKTVNGTAEALTWDLAEGSPTLIGDGSTSYVTGPGGLPLEQVAGKTTSFYHLDQLGSVRVITDTRGSSLNTYTYDAFGNVTSRTGSLANPFQYTGQYQDSESGLYYLRARFYDPSTEQFISRDPIATRTREPYVYVQDTPLNGRDPSGLDPTSHCPCVVHDITHLDIGDLLKQGAAEALTLIVDDFKKGGIKAIAALAEKAGRFIDGANYLVAYFNAMDMYSDIHDSDLKFAGMTFSILVQTIGAGAVADILTFVGAAAGAAVTGGPDPIGAAIGAIVGAFGGGVLGGIWAYLTDVIDHCMLKQVEEKRHQQQAQHA